MKPHQRTPLPILSHQDEEILRALYQYRYMTVSDTAHLLFSPASEAYARKRLSRLAGGTDLHPNAYLCRFPMPKAGSGNSEKIFTLGFKGRNFLQREGMNIDWYFRPSKYRDLGFSHLRHALLVTRFVIAAHYWSNHHPDFSLKDIRLSYDLARTSAKVIPDAWLLFENRQGDNIPIMIEIDRGMEFRDKFKRHVKARIDFLFSGEYARIFGTKAVIIAYATTGQRPEYRETRQATMTAWTLEVLEELGAQSWAGIFRFTSLVLGTVYTQGLFDQPVWYRIDSPKPEPLLMD